MINFHPTNEQLDSYVLGNLSPAESLVVAAHCDMCECCREYVAEQTEYFADDSFSTITDIEFSPSSKGDYEKMLDHIVTLPEYVPEKQSLSKQANTLSLDGRVFELPKTLQRYASKTGNWSSLVGKLWQAPVDIGGERVGHFIYMAKGGSVPEHTHRGTEITLVINGEFSDGVNKYDSGDFMIMNNSHTHAPIAEAEEGCLVFSMVDKPLQFTSGLARLLNPFSHLFFKKR